MQNEAASYVAEYAARKRFAKLGYTSDIRTLSAYKSEIFAIIDFELDKIHSEEMKKRSKKNGR